MNEPKINITVMSGAQMNGYVKEQHNYFGPVQQISKTEGQKSSHDDSEVVEETEEVVCQERNEEVFHFIHPELNEKEAWRIHNAIKRLVANYRIPDICAYLKEQKQNGKLLLPSNPSNMYNELVRLGMPKGEGFSEKNFSNSYTK